MDNWLTIWDDEFADFGKRAIAFACPGGDYQLAVDDMDQDILLARHSEEERIWPIFSKEVCEGVFRLSGMAWGGQTGDFLEATYWYELLLTTPSTITYYGDRVLVRQDFEVLRSPPPREGQSFPAGNE